MLVRLNNAQTFNEIVSKNNFFFQNLMLETYNSFILVYLFVHCIITDHLHLYINVYNYLVLNTAYR